jgi:hypothetical protein
MRENLRMTEKEPTRWRLPRNLALRAACAFVAGMLTRQQIISNHDMTWIPLVALLLLTSVVGE